MRLRPGKWLKIKITLSLSLKLVLLTLGDSLTTVLAVAVLLVVTAVEVDASDPVLAILLLVKLVVGDTGEWGVFALDGEVPILNASS